MKPIRYESDTERVVTNCVNYMREWFNVSAPDWMHRTVDGTEKIHLISENEIIQLDLPFDGNVEISVGYEGDENNFANYALATTIMIERLKGKANLSAEYISAIGFRSAVTATQEATRTSIQRIA